MKKTLSVILIALIAMTGLFAANAIDGTSFDGSKADTQLTLTLDSSVLESYKIGFTANGSFGNMASSVPDPLDNIDLEYTRGGLTKSNIGYVYYYIKAATLPTVTLTAGNGFSTKTVGYTEDIIKYTITAGGFSSTSGTQKGIDLDLGELTDGVCQGEIGFGIEILEPGNVDADFSKATWTDTITVSIGSV